MLVFSQTNACVIKDDIILILITEVVLRKAHRNVTNILYKFNKSKFLQPFPKQKKQLLLSQLVVDPPPKPSKATSASTSVSSNLQESCGYRAIRGSTRRQRFLIHSM